jgi:ribosomal protein S6
MADRRYETLVLIHPEQGEPGSKELGTRIRTLIEEQGRKREPGTGVGCCDLAYRRQAAAGVLRAVQYRATPKALQEIERNLTLMDPVLRFISVRQAENAPPAALRPVRRPERDEAEVEEESGEDVDLMGNGEMT